MNTANNKRRRESVERIEKAFLDLLQSQEFNQVSISDLCKKAQLNRSTFYANYTDIYELADSIRDKLEDNLSVLYQDEIAIGYDSHDYLKLFRHIRENQIFYKTYFKLGYDNQYKIISYNTDLARQHFDNRFIDYHMAFFKSGLTQIIKMWLENGCRESPEDMFEIIQSEYRGRREFFMDE